MPNLRSRTWTSTDPAKTTDAQFWEDHLISDDQNTQISTNKQDIADLKAGGGTGGGHTIENASGTAMAKETILQFLNADVSDDSTNKKTVVDCKGAKGDAGSAATVAVGTVTTLAAGSSATVENAGSSSAAVFNFGIPKGADGSGTGDMLKSVYDTNNDGIVDHAALADTATSANSATSATTAETCTGNAATATTATNATTAAGYTSDGAIATALASKAGLSADEQTITLAASSWDSTAQTITVSVTGVTATSNQDILPLLATSTANITNNTNLASAGIYDYGQAAGTITLYATTVPTTDLQVRVIVRGD